MNSLNKYMVALVALIAFVIGGAVVNSVRQVQATPETAPQVISATIAEFGRVFNVGLYYPDKQRIYYWSQTGSAPTCYSVRINSPGQPPTVDKACE